MDSPAWDREELERSVSDPHLAEARCCPFCGGSNLALVSFLKSALGPKRWQVKCCACRSCGPAHLSPEAAVQFWNGNRPSPVDGPFSQSGEIED